MNLELLINNIGYAVSFCVCLGLGILVLVKRQPGAKSPNIIFFFFSLSVAIWQASYVIGVNLHDPSLSRLAFMFNLANIFAVVTSAHVILAVTGRFERQKRVLIALYAIATALTAYYVIFPDSFLLLSLPQMYLPNFFVAGPFYEIQDAFFFVVTIYFLWQLLAAYHGADYLMRNRLKYFIVATVFGYAIALSPEFLLYGYQIDPILACLTGFYTVPMAYAIIKYDIVDLNLLAKRAMGYALSIAGVTLFILLIGYINDYITQAVPTFPQWFVPLVSGMIAVGVGVFAWRRLREVDILKYEFVDIITHKFMTPLTYVNWSVDILRKKSLDAEEIQAVDAIQTAGTRLTQLVDTLVGLSDSDETEFIYSYKDEDIRTVIRESLEMVSGLVAERQVSIEDQLPADLPHVHADKKKIQFAVQTILENSVIYSPPGKSVRISAIVDKDFVTIGVRDQGIGISKDDMHRLFTKFYRTSSAVHTHTEGLGIGLYLSHDILKRHGGELWAESDGPGMGSTFFLKIPREK
jgi:signal transduction histidine kinase